MYCFIIIVPMYLTMYMYILFIYIIYIHIYLLLFLVPVVYMICMPIYYDNVQMKRLFMHLSREDGWILLLYAIAKLFPTHI